jgi:V8-like Glu-specific endopeptidase
MATDWRPIAGANSLIKKLARSVVAFIDVNNWQEDTTQNSFVIQQAFATGFLYSSGKMITAGHVIRKYNIDKARFVFDFNKNNAIIPSVNVHYSKNMWSNIDPDWGWVVINNGATQDSLDVRKFSNDTKVVAIGYPDGQPTRYADNANIKDVDANLFIIEVPGIEGASGSPIISLNDNNVVGIIIEETSQAECLCLKIDAFIGEL